MSIATMKTKATRRVLLLTTARTYRGQAFQMAADQLGIDVIRAVDMRSELAEHWQLELGVDYRDPDSAAARIAQFSKEMPLDAILAVDDSGTLLAAKASALLGLRHNSPQASRAASDKYLMRSIFAEHQVPCPWFRRFSTGDDLAGVAALVPYPCVVKPLDLNGSRGVIRADDASEFMAAVKRLDALLQSVQPTQADHSYLVEAYISGDEVALEGMLDDGELTILALFDKPDPLVGPFFEETIYVTPSRHPASVQESIGRCAATAAAALGLRDGPIHAELRINDAGPWMLEIAGRSIGGMCSQTLRFRLDGSILSDSSTVIPNLVIPNPAGISRDVSLEELILRQACGLPFALPRTDQASGVMMIPIPESGILKDYSGVELAEAVPLIEDVQITAKRNYSLTALPEGDSYLGFIFARGATPEEVEDALRVAHDCLLFEIMPELALSLM